MKNPSEENRFRTWLKSNYGIQDYEAYRNTQTEELAIQFAAQSVREDRESRWVSVKDRLPETETGCYTSNGTNGQIAYLTGMTSTKTGLRMWQEDDGYFHHDITHWQPLPSPPTNKG